MTLQANLTSLAVRVGTEFNTLRSEIKEAAGVKINDLSSSSDSATWSINRIKQEIEDGEPDLTPYAKSAELTNYVKTSALNDYQKKTEALKINDFSSSVSSVYSSSKVDSQIRAAIDKVVDGAPEALDTLKEIATKLQDGSITSAITAKLAEIGDMSHNFVADFEGALSS